MLDAKLYTFLTLCQTMHYRKTAECLHMTQPAVTQHIQALERQYGCKLFHYDRRQLTKTDAAYVLERYARSACVLEQEAKGALCCPETLHLRVGATKTIGEFVIPSAVCAFLSDPSHKLELTVDNTAVLLRMLDENQLDVALVEGLFDKSSYDYQLLRREPFMGVCGKNHPFAGQIVPFKEVFTQHLFLREEGSGTRAVLEQLLAERNFTVGQFHRITTVNSFALIKTLVKRSGGITFAYQAVAASDSALDTFTAGDAAGTREFNVVWLKGAGMERHVSSGVFLALLNASYNKECDL